MSNEGEVAGDGYKTRHFGHFNKKLVKLKHVDQNMKYRHCKFLNLKIMIANSLIFGG